MPAIKSYASRTRNWPKLPDRRKYSDPEEYLIELDKVLRKMKKLDNVQ